MEIPLEEEQEDTNKEISDVLFEISAYYLLAKDKQREKTFDNAARIISTYDEVITSGKQAETIYGIGKSISSIIDEYLKTGQVKRLKMLQDDFVTKKPIMDYFMSFYGIGPVKAADLINKGYTTLAQLWNNKDKLLTQAQQAGILWREHIPIRIPKDEMDTIHDTISDIFKDEEFKWEMAGSFRRQEESSGDIDILIQRDDNVDMNIIVDILEPYLPTILSQGVKKLAGIFRLSDEYYGHRIDILIIAPESWHFALLHFTGSGRFNILMRHRAKEFGLKLSEYSLTDENDDRILVNDEKDIFDILKVEYLSPIERTKTLKSLTYI